MNKIVLFFVLIAFSTLHAQTFHRCGTVEAMHEFEETHPGYLDAVNAAFDMAKAQSASIYQKGIQEDWDTIYRFPIVVHIVYNTAAENLDDSVVLSQIDVLNEDFRRLNADTGNVRAEFVDVAGDAGIEFYLADTDPTGAPTTGITRFNTSVANFGGGFIPNPTDVDKVKSSATDGVDPWPTDKYVNIWVCNTGGSILGLAYPPAIAPNWPAGSAGDSSVQGLVIHYEVLGRNNPFSSTPGNMFNGLADQGRTATHEMGHYLGLRHIWGDGPLSILGFPDCTVDDGISDTPNSGTNSQLEGCDFSKNTCTDGSPDLPDMVENYMDYSTEACQNMFTKEQIGIMRSMAKDGRPGLADIETQGDTVISVGIREVYEADFNVFPNPAANTISVDFDNHSDYKDIEIYNLQGQVLKQIDANAQTIDVSSFPNGLYLISVLNENGERTQPIKFSVLR